MKKILLTNDDGINFVGLEASRNAIEGLGEIYTVAPKTEQSGQSRAATVKKPFGYEVLDERKVVVDGTPTDCVYVARDMFGDFDLIVSGINLGYNLGIDAIMWSGTFGAAMEGAAMGWPSIAVSTGFIGNKIIFETTDDVEGYTAAGKVLRKYAKEVLSRGMPKNVQMLNINVPRKPKAGEVFAPLGKDYIKVFMDRGKNYYRFAPKLEPEVVPGVDTHVVFHENKTCITPISLKGLDTNIKSLERYWKK